MEIEKFFLHEFHIDNEFERKGGEALVSKAMHPRLGKVVIKQWTDDACHNNNEIRFLTQNCNHPNIIQFMGILISNESCDIGYIMPYMPMGSLHDVIHNKTQNYDQKQMSSWITEICYGLSYLHFKNIIHTNIKPSNVLLGKSYDDIKLSDFGMTRSPENITYSLFKGLGNVLYMAPEIRKGENYTVSADIYSLSMTIWEILHRRKPFDHFTSQNSSVLELCIKISEGERPVLRSDLSKEAADMLKKCWNANVAVRPTVDKVLELIKSTEFVYLDLKNSVEGSRTSPENLNDNETILLLGGFDGCKKLDSLSLLQNNGENGAPWKELNIKLPCPLGNHGAQFLNDNLYIFGGRNETDILNSTYKLTRKCLTKRLQWEKMADINKKREEISNSNVVLNNHIWIMGGWNGILQLKSVERYNPRKNVWKNMKDMNEFRNLAAAAVVNEKIFCCGGYNGNNYVNSAECYDLSSDVWTLISNMPGPNGGCGAVAMDKHLIIIGGKTSTFKNFLNSVWILDTADENAKWIEKEACLSFARSEFGIAKIGDKIFVCGGAYLYRKPSTCISTAIVEIFDGDVRRHGTKMTIPRFNAAAVVIPMKFARNLEPVTDDLLGKRLPSSSKSTRCSIQ